MAIYTIEKAISLPKEERKNVTIEGLMEQLVEEFDKNGKPYIKGVLSDKVSRLEFKMWQTSLDEFLKKSKLNSTKPRVVQIRGNLDEYNEVIQMILTGDGLAAVEKDIDNYIYAAPYKPEQFYAGIMSQVDKFTHEGLKTLVKYILETFKNKLLVLPYSTMYHTEKSGLIYHIYLCVCKVLNLSGMPLFNGKEVKTSTDVMLSAVICHRLCGILRYEIDTLGKVVREDEIDKAMFGELSNILILNDTINRLIYENKLSPSIEIEHLTHCVAACSGLIKPATIEAELVKEFICSDLRTYTMLETRHEIGSLESKKIILPGGDQRRVINIPVYDSSSYSEEEDIKEAAEATS